MNFKQSFFKTIRNVRFYGAEYYRISLGLLFVGLILTPSRVLSQPYTAYSASVIVRKTDTLSHTTDDPALAAKVDTIASRVLRQTGVPSASVAVVVHGRIAYLQAYGSARLNPRIAANTSMRYAIGSISKQFTAATILILEQEGKLSLNDPISKWLPDLTRANEVTCVKYSHTLQVTRISGHRTMCRR